MKKLKKFAILGALISIVGLDLMILAVTINENLAPISILIMIFGSLLVMPYRIIGETPKDIICFYDKNGKYIFKCIESAKEFLLKEKGQKAMFGHLTRSFFHKERKTAYGYTITYIDPVVTKYGGKNI